MDRISGLSDELLVRILTFVPTKVAVSTSLLSKRWEFVWTWVPKLEFVDNKYGSDLAIRDFIKKNLPLLKPPVIETFRLKCFSSFPPEEITQVGCNHGLSLHRRARYRVYALIIGSSCFSGCSGMLLSCESSNSTFIVVDVSRSISRSAGTMTPVLFLHVCWRALELSSLQITGEDKKRETLSVLSSNSLAT
ncbi:hypothetical protein Bca4012_082652 [Brassica carinata]